MCYIFRRPIALIDIPLGDLHSFSDKFLLLTKHHVLKTNNKKLSLSEIFSHGVAFSFLQKIFEENEVKIVDNSPEEIRDLAIEMLDNLENKNSETYETDKLQAVFRQLFSENLKTF